MDQAISTSSARSASTATAALDRLAPYVLSILRIMTALLFPIGMFPWIMIAATLIFFDERDYALLYNLLRRVVPVQFQLHPALPERSKWQAPRISRGFAFLLGAGDCCAGKGDQHYGK